jgi:regulatory protein
VIVTALRERPRGRVQVELDGRPWRLLPADAVVGAGLVTGRALDRETARLLARELRRVRALNDAVRVLRHRDVSRRRLDERLQGRGAGPAARAEALAVLERAGLLDDRRAAAQRALGLAGRGYGDAAIRCALEDDGIALELVEEALAGLEPEAERARRLLGPDRDPKALRRLAAKGFGADLLAELAGFAEWT